MSADRARQWVWEEGDVVVLPRKRRRKLAEHSDPSRPDYGLLHPGGGGAAGYGLITPVQDFEDFEADFASLAIEDEVLVAPSTDVEENTAQIKDGVVRGIATETGLPYETVNAVIKQWAHSANDADMRSLALQRDISREMGVPFASWQKGQIAKVKAAHAEAKARARDIDAEIERAAARLDAVLEKAEGKGGLTPAKVKDRLDQLVGDKSIPTVERTLLALGSNSLAAYKRASWEGERSHLFGQARQALRDRGAQIKRFRQREVREPKYRPLYSSKIQRKVIRAVYERTQRALAAQGIERVTLARGVRGQKIPRGEQRVNLSAASSWTRSRDVAEDFTRAFSGWSDTAVMYASVPRERVLSMYATGWGCRREKEWLVLGGEATVYAAEPSYLREHGDPSRPGYALLHPSGRAVGGPLFAALRNEGGFTFEPVSGTHPSKGWVVAPSKTTEAVFDEATFGRKNLRDYVHKHEKELSDPEMSLGGWKNGGKIYLDVSKVTTDQADAVATGVRGRQIGIYNLGTGEYKELDRLDYQKYGGKDWQGLWDGRVQEGDGQVQEAGAVPAGPGPAAGQDLGRQGRRGLRPDHEGGRAEEAEQAQEALTLFRIAALLEHSDPSRPDYALAHPGSRGAFRDQLMGDERQERNAFKRFHVEPGQVDDFIKAAESELRSLVSEEAPLAVRRALRERAYIVNPNGEGLAIEGWNDRVMLTPALVSAFRTYAAAEAFMAGATLTHLHPVFTPPSAQDLATMAARGLKSVRVVAGPYTWEMRSTMATRPVQYHVARARGKDMELRLRGELEGLSGTKRESTARRFLEKEWEKAAAENDWFEFERLRPVEAP